MTEAALALRKTTHKTLAAVTDHVENLRFNVAVARLYELVNAIAAALPAASSDRSLGWALREALEFLVEMLAPMMPHLAEEAWSVLGHRDLVAMRAWPNLDRSFLADNTILLPVQINGRKRAELTIAAEASQADIEAATLALDPVRQALAGRAPRKVIVVPKRIVNVVL
jgi:leucyl-tRNA synthetase